MSFLKQSFDSNPYFDCDAMHYQQPFRVPIKHKQNHNHYEADTEDNDTLPDDWVDYDDVWYDDGNFFIFELDF
jgi:hypothetical protein